MDQPSPNPETQPQISISPNGPYVVEGSVPLQNARGGEIESRQTYALCRCGRSAEKPFCDGAHAKVGFSGENAAGRGPIEGRRVAYKGNGITVHDDRSICSHAGVCTDDLPSVFRMGQEPWCDPRAGEVEKIIDVVKRCPSGALSYGVGDSMETVEEEADPMISVSKDGPYEVVGRLELQPPDGSPYETRARYTLCRCGASKNKPYCDGTHWRIGFKDG
ncbi:MAG: CDGSH iron-sulfur domain-containing protein [Nitrospinota bacterium]